MARDLKDFWRRFQSGIEVAVAGTRADKRLGVRDGFLRYFHDGLLQRDGLTTPVSVVVVPQDQPDEETTPLPLSDAETLDLAARRARRLEEALGAEYGFYVGVEAGLVPVEAAGLTRHVVRCWAVVRGLGEETWGSGGSVQVPAALTSGVPAGDLALAVPGRRRQDGMVSSLTGGLETRRLATGLATFHALATRMYGLLESRPRRPPGA